MFALHWPALKAKEGKFAADPKWRELRDTYDAQYPDWKSRAEAATAKLGKVMRYAWAYHRARIQGFLGHLARAADYIDRFPAALAAYESAGGTYGADYRRNLQELCYQGYILSSHVMADAVPLALKADAKFVLWGSTALTVDGAAFGSAYLSAARKYETDARRQYNDLVSRTTTMNKGAAAAGSAPSNAVRRA